MRSAKFTLAVILLFFTSISYTQSAIDTSWNGAIDIMGTKIGIGVKFTTTGKTVNAVMDIPEQGAMGLELEKVSFSNPKVHFELAASNGTAVFEGLYYGDSIGGTFVQSGINGRFSLVRGELVSGSTEIDTVEKTFNTEDVTFFNDGNTFAGTITYPKGEGKYPAVVLITGSGAQNRDEEIYGFKIFKIIAEHLANNDIAVLRYDDRGVGGSKGKSVNESTTMDFAGDVVSAVELLKTKEYVNPMAIGLLGHSEGGIV
ncbi:MAG TPA: alpha/beta hydrolase, partial [Bacteroidetes bacterium]|nr:alpha/beta hydrolase [Bacteroidota bacterium]